MCTLCDNTLFKYLITDSHALAREHLTYAPLHDRMLHIEITTALPLAFPVESASFNLGELAGRSREHWPTSLSALGILASTHRWLRRVWVCFPRACGWSSFSVSLWVVSRGYLYIYLPAYLCIILVYTYTRYIHVGAVRAFVSVRPTARGEPHRHLAKTASTRGRDRIQPRNNPAGILSGISRPHWNGDSLRAGNLNADKRIVIVACIAAGWYFIAMLMITLKRFRGAVLTRIRHEYCSRELSLKQSRYTKCYKGKDYILYQEFKGITRARFLIKTFNFTKIKMWSPYNIFGK